MDAQKSVGSIKSQAGLDLTEKVKELLRLAREQGHLTYEDLNGALPEAATPNTASLEAKFVRLSGCDTITGGPPVTEVPTKGAPSENLRRSLSSPAGSAFSTKMAAFSGRFI